MSQDITQQLTSQIMDKAAVMRGQDQELAFRRQRLAAVHATQAGEATKTRELLLQKTELATGCTAESGRVEILRNDLVAARQELMHIGQREKEVASQIKALKHFYKDEYDRLDQLLQQEQEEQQQQQQQQQQQEQSGSSPMSILQTTEQRELALHHFCMDVLQRAYLSASSLMSSTRKLTRRGQDQCACPVGGTAAAETPGTGS